MKKIVFLLLFSIISKGQVPTDRTFRTLTEACLRNQPGSGLSPQMLKFYVDDRDKRGLVLGKTLWTKNTNNVITKLRPGNYYVVQGNRAVKVGILGIADNIIGCETGTVTPPEPQAYLLSTNQNVINWKQFGNFQLTFGQAQYGVGAPRFSNETDVPNDPLSHGWTHVDSPGINPKTYVPVEKGMRYFDVNTALDMQVVAELLDEGKTDAIGLRTWTESLNSVSSATALEAGKKLYYSSWGGWNSAMNGYDFRVGMPLLLENKWKNADAERGRIMDKIIEGMKSEATALGNSFIPQIANAPFNGCNGGFIANNTAIPFSELRFFPNHSATEIANFKTVPPIISRYLSRPSIQVIDNFNFRVPFPMTESLYKKDANNQYVLKDGKRIPRDSDFSETQYGQMVNFYASPKDVSYYTGSNYLPEAWYATIQPYAFYSHLIFSRMALNNYFNNNTNITNKDNFSASLVATVRDETENGYFAMSSQSRPISPYLAELQVYATYLTGVKNFQVQTTYGRRAGLTEPEGFKVRPYGQNYAHLKNGTPVDIPKNWGTFEVYTAVLKYLQSIENAYDIWTGSEKYWQATTPSDKTNQVLLFGILSGNNLVIFGTDSRLDKNEQITVNFTLSNQSGFLKTFNIKGRQHFVNIFQLPVGTYTTDNLRFQYNDIYGTMHKHTGNLQNPNW